jgi:hypothetical protein
MWHGGFKAAHWHTILKGEITMEIDNAIIHYYPLSPYIAKVQVNLRRGTKIVASAVLKDHEAATRFLERFPGVEIKNITHC